MHSAAEAIIRTLDARGPSTDALRRASDRVRRAGLTSLSKKAKYLILQNLSALKIRAARESFWVFCALLYPNYYKESRWHLRLLCEVLQSLYERRLFLADGRPARKLMINMPPRHGKSRTLILFCAWLLGKNKKEMIIACSYNDALATDFSRYTRDEIQKVKNIPLDVVYSDIFPASKIKHGDASYLRWALQGQHFSYLGAGVGSGITGKGCTVAIVDDPIKDVETAINAHSLEKVWRWYTDTFQSRQEENAIEIVNHTRWAEKDPCGRILSGARAPDWFVLRLDARLASGEMLCPDLLSLEKYLELKDTMSPEILNANYHQKPMTLTGRMYKAFRTYKISELPEGRIISYADTADEGSDYLAAFVAVEHGDDLYILDAVYTQAPMEITEPLLSDMYIKYGVNYAVIESNNGGKSFARSVRRIIKERREKMRGVHSKTVVAWKHNAQNKHVRIYTQSAYVQQHVYFPEGWKHLHPELYTALAEYQKSGNNKHDDAPDAVTGLVEIMGKGKGAELEAADAIM